MNSNYERIDDNPRFDGKIRDSHEARYSIASQFVEFGDTVLDAGCGAGYGKRILTGELLNEIKWIGIDRKPAGSHISCADFNLPGEIMIEDFDVFVGLEVIEHLTDDGVYNFLELARRAKKFIIISTPIVPNSNPFHLQKFTPESIPAFFATEKTWELYMDFVQDKKYGIYIFKHI